MRIVARQMPVPRWGASISYILAIAPMLGNCGQVPGGADLDYDWPGIGVIKSVPCGSRQILAVPSPMSLQSSRQSFGGGGAWSAATKRQC